MEEQQLAQHKDVNPGTATASSTMFRLLLGYSLSVIVTAAMLLLAFGVMVCSLNLQGYIGGQLWTERPFYIPVLAWYASEGAILDPNQRGITPEMGLLGTVQGTVMPLIPVRGHHTSVSNTCVLLSPGD